MDRRLDAEVRGRGAVVDAQTMYELSCDWYATRLERNWAPPSAGEAEAVFASHGLTGEFWEVGDGDYSAPHSRSWS
jgi:hypothetical protein